MDELAIKSLMSRTHTIQKLNARQGSRAAAVPFPQGSFQRAAGLGSSLWPLGGSYQFHSPQTEAEAQGEEATSPKWPSEGQKEPYPPYP